MCLTRTTSTLIEESGQLLTLPLSSKENDVVNRAQRAKHIGAIFLGIDRSIVAFIALYRGVGIERNHKRIALVASKRQVSDMAAVKDVEATNKRNEILFLLPLTGSWLCAHLGNGQDSRPL